jgi:hypothetical protein
MKQLTIVLAGLISILFATSAPAQTPVEQARTFQVDTAHSGSITSPGLVPPLRQKWSINFGDLHLLPNHCRRRSHMRTGDSFASTAENGLRRFDPATGTVIWTKSIGGPYHLVFQALAPQHRKARFTLLK